MRQFPAWLLAASLLASGCATPASTKHLGGPRSPNGRWEIQQARERSRTITLFCGPVNNKRELRVWSNFRGVPLRTFWGGCRDETILVITDLYAPNRSSCHLYYPEKKRFISEIARRAAGAFTKASPMEYDVLHTVPRAVSPDGRKLLVYIWGQAGKVRNTHLFIVDIASRDVLKTYPGGHGAPIKWWEE